MRKFCESLTRWLLLVIPLSKRLQVGIAPRGFDLAFGGFQHLPGARLARGDEFGNNSGSGEVFPVFFRHLRLHGAGYEAGGIEDAAEIGLPESVENHLRAKNISSVILLATMRWKRFHGRALRSPAKSVPQANAATFPPRHAKTSANGRDAIPRFGIACRGTDTFYGIACRGTDTFYGDGKVASPKKFTIGSVVKVDSYSSYLYVIQGADKKIVFLLIGLVHETANI
jgi:hypothetical protein